MKKLLTKVIGKFQKMGRTTQTKKIDLFAKKYMEESGLMDLLNEAKEKSISTGVNFTDYVVLHSYIRQHKVQYVLECGTGMSTWVLAHALKKNHAEFGIEGKVVSMESIPKYYQNAVDIFPESLKAYADLRCSPAVPYQYSIIRGTAFKEIPDYKYGLFFVDGPELTLTEGNYSYETANMDFIRYMINADHPVTAIIDSRLRTCIAYGTIFGKERIKLIKPWISGIIENVTKKDMILNNEGTDLWKCTQQAVQVEFDNPSWLKDKI